MEQKIKDFLYEAIYSEFYNFVSEIMSELNKKYPQIFEYNSEYQIELNVIQRDKIIYLFWDLDWCINQIIKNIKNKEKKQKALNKKNEIKEIIKEELYRLNKDMVIQIKLFKEKRTEYIDSYIYEIDKINSRKLIKNIGGLNV
jgi:hypothetical protein